MQLENRYLVLKIADVDKYLCEDNRNILSQIVNLISEGRFSDNKELYPKFICIKDSWPEYEEVKQKLLNRVSRQNAARSWLE